MYQWESGRYEIEGSLVKEPPEALLFVLEQDTLSSA